jgi:hypothetical protein
LVTETADELDFVFLEEDMQGVTVGGGAAVVVVATAVEVAEEAAKAAGF